VTAFARWSNSPMSRLAAGETMRGRREPTDNTILSCWSHAHAACADSFMLETTAPRLRGIGRQVCDESASWDNARGNPGKEPCSSRSFLYPSAPTTPIVFKGGIGHENVAHLHNAGVHTFEATA
jgi:hypothetical protein